MNTTTSKIHATNSGMEEERRLLRGTCNTVASKGGSFSIVNTWDGTAGCWYTIYTINWPEDTK